MVFLVFLVLSFCLKMHEEMCYIMQHDVRTHGSHTPNIRIWGSTIWMKNYSVLLIVKNIFLLVTSQGSQKSNNTAHISPNIGIILNGNIKYIHFMIRVVTGWITSYRERKKRQENRCMSCWPSPSYLSLRESFCFNWQRHGWPEAVCVCAC